MTNDSIVSTVRLQAHLPSHPYDGAGLQICDTQRMPVTGQCRDGRNAPYTPYTLANDQCKLHLQANSDLN